MRTRLHKKNAKWSVRWVRDMVFVPVGNSSSPFCSHEQSKQFHDERMRILREKLPTGVSP